MQPSFPNHRDRCPHRDVGTGTTRLKEYKANEKHWKKCCLDPVRSCNRRWVWIPLEENPRWESSWSRTAARKEWIPPKRRTTRQGCQGPAICLHPHHFRSRSAFSFVSRPQRPLQHLCRQRVRGRKHEQRLCCRRIVRPAHGADVRVGVGRGQLSGALCSIMQPR